MSFRKSKTLNTTDHVLSEITLLVSYLEKGGMKYTRIMLNSRGSDKKRDLHAGTSHAYRGVCEVARPQGSEEATIHEYMKKKKSDRKRFQEKKRERNEVKGEESHCYHKYIYN